MKIALCGSTRFKKEFEEWNRKLGLAGHVVYSLSCFGREVTDEGKPDTHPVFSEDEKIVLDLVHLNKILNSDIIVVINPEGYTGFSTKREIRWATMVDKHIYHTDKAFHFSFMPYESYPAEELLSGRN